MDTSVRKRRRNGQQNSRKNEEETRKKTSKRAQRHEARGGPDPRVQSRLEPRVTARS